MPGKGQGRSCRKSALWAVAADQKNCKLRKCSTRQNRINSSTTSQLGSWKGGKSVEKSGGKQKEKENEREREKERRAW